MNALTYIFLAALALSVITRLWLSFRQTRHVARHRDHVPDEFSSSVSLEEHQKAADYSAAKIKLGSVDMFISTGVLLLWTLGGGIQLLDNSVHAAGLSPLLHGAAVILALFFVNALIDIPTSLYMTFVVEERFGFNKMTPLLFLTDLIKSLTLVLLLGTPLILVSLWFMKSAGNIWWLYVWMVWMGFSLLISWAWPVFIAPLFNKFSPLQDDNLRSRIEELLTRCGFKSNGIFVMDGSRRSAHGNAYFTGLGNNKRIVFFDTLIESLNENEVEAVLAHELGHFRHKHIVKRLIASAVITLGMLALLGWLAEQQWFYQGLGIASQSNHAALLLFILVSPVFTFFVGPVSAWFSRKHEFEADTYAAKQSDARYLIT
ncbi:MAG: M48 family metallopeptidase, partial [Gammaproteobacteria bacterium]|nr:M48 family metallopeptidase [Gammaproteobacteria bacterium]